MLKDYVPPTERSYLHVMDFPYGQDRLGETRTGALVKLPSFLTEAQACKEFQMIVPLTGVGPSGFVKGPSIRRSAGR